MLETTRLSSVVACLTFWQGQMAWKLLDSTKYKMVKEAPEKRFEPKSKHTLYSVKFQTKGCKKETCSNFADELACPGR